MPLAGANFTEQYQWLLHSLSCLIFLVLALQMLRSGVFVFREGCRSAIPEATQRIC
jgi:hypothetical protein